MVQLKSNGIVVVTGASSGIGRSLARELHALGKTLILIARREERLRELQNELNANRPDSAEIRVCDLSVREEVLKLADELKNRKVQGLVNNAGVGSMGPFKDLNLTAELAQVEVNIVAPMILTKAVIENMVSMRDSFIINVSSIMAFQAVSCVATYSASKAFELRHSSALERELRDIGVAVLTLCPGPTETEFFGVAKVPNGVTNFKRGSPDYVAQKCLQDLAKGKTISIPTFKAKVLVFIAQVVPSRIYLNLIYWYLKKFKGFQT